MKKVISFISLFTLLSVGTYVPKSQAGIALGTTGIVFLGVAGGMNNAGAYGPAILGAGLLAGGVIPTIAGGITAFFVPAVGIPLLILSEDGNFSQHDLEGILSQKYDFISDREVISAIASEIKIKAKNQNPDKDGKILVRFTKEEVAKLVSPLDLTPVEFDQVVSDLQ